MESVARTPYVSVDPAQRNESPLSGISWAAVLGGAFVAAAIAFLLMALGAGMGLSSISPWPRAGLSVSRVAPGAIVWIVLVQLLSSALGGYLAGRLRTKWVSLHTHEVYFRDTAHGLLVWAVSLVLGVAFLSSLATSMAKDFAETDKDGQASGVSYYVDSLFRATDPNLVPRDPALREEVSLILIKALRDPAIGAQDRTYIARLISARTGLTTAEASRRLDETIASARDAVDRARKAVAHSLYWLVVALLIGAFSGSFAATIGGRQRDSVETV